jgi:cell wall-associated NlpC family hydrolase
MPNRLRSPLLAFAIAALAFSCTAAAARHDRPARGDRPARVERVSAPDNRPRPIRRVSQRRKRTLGERAARIALEAVGVPYRWGGTSPSSGFDCSGLVYWAYGRLGVDLPHSSYALADTGRRVGRSRLKPGDVLVFSGYGHVGLYVGRDRMVHAPNSGRVVEVVRLGGSHYGSRLVSARRITRSSRG